MSTRVADTGPLVNGMSRCRFLLGGKGALLLLFALCGSLDLGKMCNFAFVDKYSVDGTQLHT